MSSLEQLAQSLADDLADANNVKAQLRADLATANERIVALEATITKLDIECIRHMDRVDERDEQIESMAMHWGEVELDYMNRIEDFEAERDAARAALRRLFTSLMDDSETKEAIIEGVEARKEAAAALAPAQPQEDDSDEKAE